MHVWPKTAKVATIAGVALATLSATGATVGAAVMPATARAAAVKAAAAASSPWSQTDYNAALSRANLTEQTLTAATVANAGYLRSVASPPPPLSGFCNNVPDQGVVAPSLVGGALYAMTDGRLTKYDAATGAIVWRHNPDPTFSQTYQSLAVAGGLVVVGGLNCGSVSQPQGTIWAFNASTGARVWTKFVPSLGNLQSLVVSGGFVVAAGSSDGSGLVVTVRKLGTGANVWTRSGGANCSFFPLPLMVVDQVVISPGTCAQTPRMVGRNLTTGAVLWQRIGNFTPLRGDSDTTTGRHVFATTPGGAVIGLDPLTGKTQYSLAGAANVLAVDGSQAYAACGGGSNVQVCAYDSATGSLKWQATPEIFSEPTLAAEAGGVLYLAEGFALDTTTGTTLATLWDPFDLLSASLAVGDGRVAAVLDKRVVDLYGLPGS
jgi:outer membrane protein assembly factor BamB